MSQHVGNQYLHGNIKHMTKKEIQTLIDWFNIVSKITEGDMHPTQENATYAEGVLDCIRLLKRTTTIKELNNTDVTQL